MCSAGHHERSADLSPETRDMARAIVALMEELEAVDGYDQRHSACTDEALKAILAHNRNEEKKHASTLLEWIQQRDPTFSREMQDYLFTDQPLTRD